MSTDEQCVAAPVDGDGRCRTDGGSSFVDLSGLVYDAATGIFTGTLLTNQCNRVTTGVGNPSNPTPSCIEQVCSSVAYMQ